MSQENVEVVRRWVALLLAAQGQDRDWDAGITPGRADASRGWAC
jgi:hypothetical protein